MQEREREKQNICIHIIGKKASDVNCECSLGCWSACCPMFLDSPMWTRHWPVEATRLTSPGPAWSSPAELGRLQAGYGWWSWARSMMGSPTPTMRRGSAGRRSGDLGRCWNWSSPVWDWSDCWQNRRAWVRRCSSCLELVWDLVWHRGACWWWRSAETTSWRRHAGARDIPIGSSDRPGFARSVRAVAAVQSKPVRSMKRFCWQIVKEEKRIYSDLFQFFAQFVALLATLRRSVFVSIATLLALDIFLGW